MSQFLLTDGLGPRKEGLGLEESEVGEEVQWGFGITEEMSQVEIYKIILEKFDRIKEYWA